MKTNNSDTDNQAPGKPGSDAKWSPGQKDAVGTALSDSSSSVWFTVGKGTLNEVFYPSVDTPSIRDLSLLIADGEEFFSDEHDSTETKVEWHQPGIPYFKVVNTETEGRYVLTKYILTDPEHDCVIQRVEFSAQTNYSLFVLLAPHLGGQGNDNNARIVKHGNQTLLVAERDNYALALACSKPFINASAGFVGFSDGWQDISRHKKMTWMYKQALKGNVALTGEVDIQDVNDQFTLALGFGTTVEEAIITALDSLGRDFEDIKQSYVSGWAKWLELLPPSASDEEKNSLAVLKCHESKAPLGGFIAALASPWGYAQGDSDRSGYHVIWTRDMVESIGGLIAGGAKEPVFEALKFLSRTQQPDGHWPQNMWINGHPYWNGIQMDETALPILLISLALREEAISENQAISFWPMVKKASSFLLMNGPVTQQDRWEEDPGYTPFTLSAEISALLAAADLAELKGETESARVLRETADIWYDSIDDWLYASGTEWCAKYSIAGYYERIMPVSDTNVSRFSTVVHVKNVPPADANMPAVELISPDSLALVRFGLRSPADKRITDTIKLIDELLKIETPGGITWHRYNDDGYGEHADGSPFDGTGIGRGWPLLSGERAHYELAAGNREYAEYLLQSMRNFANSGGLLPEQVWDTDDIPEYDLYRGRPTGSATPLAWAHAEFLKLIASLREGRIFDQPKSTVQRYLIDNVVSPRRAWRFNNKLHRLATGKLLRIETLSPCSVHWSTDNWQTANDTLLYDSGLGLFITDLPTDSLTPGQQIEFTFYWSQSGNWENRNFSVEIH